MNCYEHTYILKDDTSEDQKKKVAEKYENIINKNLGKVIKTQDWGLRNLSYEINKSRKGFYTHIKFEGVGETIQKLENAENIDDAILRFLTVKVKKHDLETNHFEKKD